MKVLYRKPPEDALPVHRNLDLVSILSVDGVCVPEGVPPLAHCCPLTDVDVLSVVCCLHVKTCLWAKVKVFRPPAKCSQVGKTNSPLPSLPPSFPLSWALAGSCGEAFFTVNLTTQEGRGHLILCLLVAGAVLFLFSQSHC